MTYFCHYLNHRTPRTVALPVNPKSVVSNFSTASIWAGNLPNVHMANTFCSNSSGRGESSHLNGAHLFSHLVLLTAAWSDWVRVYHWLVVRWRKAERRDRRELARTIRQVGNNWDQNPSLPTRALMVLPLWGFLQSESTDMRVKSSVWKIRTHPYPQATVKVNITLLELDYYISFTGCRLLAGFIVYSRNTFPLWSRISIQSESSWLPLPQPPPQNSHTTIAQVGKSCLVGWC